MQWAVVPQEVVELLVLARLVKEQKQPRCLAGLRFGELCSRALETGYETLQLPAVVVGTQAQAQAQKLA